MEATKQAEDRRVTLEQLKDDRDLWESWIGTTVLIWQADHGVWWRNEAASYTRKVEEAGRYDFSEAWAATSHCGAEKGIQFMRVQGPESSPSSEPSAPVLSKEIEHDLVKTLEALNEITKINSELQRQISDHLGTLSSIRALIKQGRWNRDEFSTFTDSTLAVKKHNSFLDQLEAQLKEEDTDV